MTDTMPTHDELCERYGYRTKAEWKAVEDGTATPEQRATHQPESVRAETFAEGWAFVMLARSRGWIVSNPVGNGYKDVCHVTIWKMGDADASAEGRYKSEPWDR